MDLLCRWRLSPAQSVQYGIFAILKRKPDLVVSGINYGENPATDITLPAQSVLHLRLPHMVFPPLPSLLQLASEDFFGYS